jgi:hypothetical protein
MYLKRVEPLPMFTAKIVDPFQTDKRSQWNTGTMSIGHSIGVLSHFLLAIPVIDQLPTRQKK